MGISWSDLPRGSRRRLALTVWSSAGQTDRQGGWERLVCRLVWTARLRYQVAVGWCCWGWRTVLHAVRRSALAPPCRRLLAWHPGNLFCIRAIQAFFSPDCLFAWKDRKPKNTTQPKQSKRSVCVHACMHFHAKHPTAHVKCCKAGDKGRHWEVLIVYNNNGNLMARMHISYFTATPWTPADSNAYTNALCKILIPVTMNTLSFTLLLRCVQITSSRV